MTAPRVLIADQLSPAAVDIFKQRGVDTDVKVGLSKEELEKIIKDYDGLAVRSATKATEKIIAAATNLKVIGRAGIGVDNIDVKAATAKGIIVMNTPFGNSITTAEHAISLMMALARQIPEADRSTQAGKWEKSKFLGSELYRQDARRDRLRQHRLHRGRPGDRPEDEGRCLRSFPFAPSAPWNSAWKRSSWMSCCADPISSRCTPRSPTRPGTSSTRSALTKTKKGVRIINCARGGLVDERALAAALEIGSRGRRGLRRVRGGAGQGERAVRPAERHLHAASGRLHG